MPKTIKEIINNKINKDTIYKNIIEKEENKNKIMIIKYSLLLTSFIIVLILSVFLLKPNNKIQTFKDENKNTIVKREITINEFKNISNYISTNENTSSNENINHSLKYKVPNNLNELHLYKIYLVNKDVMNFKEYNIIYSNKDNSSYIDFIFSDNELLEKDVKDYKLNESIIFNNTEIPIYKNNEYYIVKFSFRNYNYYINTKNINKKDLELFVNSL